METILHELGHGVYDKYLDPGTPYLLRTPAHTFTTEAVAMFFGRLSRNPAWMQQMLGLSDAQRAEIEKVRRPLRPAQATRSSPAGTMVMYNFREGPLRQSRPGPEPSSGGTWWRDIRLVKRPPSRTNPDWAAKIHFSAAPCYYHNYMLGELLASQWQHTLVTKVLGLQSDQGVSYIDQKKAGDYLRRAVFEAGNLYPWNEMIQRSTGEPLTAKYFVDQFVK